MHNFITLFNYNFLPQGLAMIKSLKKNSQCFIWIVCLDNKIYEFLKKKNFNNLGLIKIEELEKTLKIDFRNSRSFIEHCWMLTPFLFKYVFKKKKLIKELTYVDADVYFFKKLDEIQKEFKLSGKDIFIQEHGFHKTFEKKSENGKFCVQFLTFKNNFFAKSILNEWLNMCIKSTSIDYKKGIVGDQKYFDELILKYPENFCISKKLSFFQAPWTLDRFEVKDVGLYHFHTLRVNKRGVRLYSGYNLDQKIIQNIYLPYLNEIKKIILKHELDINQTLSGEKENVFKNFLKEIIFKFYANKFNYFLNFKDIN